MKPFDGEPKICPTEVSNLPINFAGFSSEKISNVSFCLTIFHKNVYLQTQTKR